MVRCCTSSIKLAFLTLSVSLLVACTSEPVVEKSACAQADWYELGRQDGSQGSPTDRLTQRQKQCAKSFNSEWEAVYTNGRNAGLVEYCEPKNGYDMGRMGVAYYYVCPSTVEPLFLSAYRKGQAAREIEMQNQKLDAQIFELTQKLAVANDEVDRSELNQRIAELKESRSKNEHQLSAISTN